MNQNYIHDMRKLSLANRRSMDYVYQNVKNKPDEKIVREQYGEFDI